MTSRTPPTMIARESVPGVTAVWWSFRGGGLEMAGPAVDRASAERMLRRLHEHRRGQKPVDIASMIHPQAEMRLLITFGVLLQGRAMIVEALERAQRNAELYQGTVRRFEWLDDETVLTFGRARYALTGGGHAEGRVFWLDEFRDGLIWRVHVYMREAGARRAYEEQFEKRTGASPNDPAA